MDMKIRVHRTPKSIITGVDSIGQIGAEVSKLRAKKALIMTDPGVAASGMVEVVERPLIDAGVEVGVFAKCVPEPPMSSLEEGVKFCEQGAYDCIVGFGGGSVIDVAKITSVMVGSDASVESMVGIDMVPRKGLPVIAVPTTAGTGSEVTAIAIFANEKLNVKQGVVSGFLIPNVAIVDPMLTISCPAHVTAASGMDAFIHCIEAYTSVNATMHTDPLAREGIDLISKSIRTAVFDGSNIEARAGMAIGSLMGGISFGNAGVTAVHALSYPIGGTFHVPHGVANTLMLPWVMEYNMLACLPYFAEIAVAMGENVEGLSVRDAAARAVDAMKQLAIDIQVPQYLSDVGIPESAIEELADSAMTQTRLLVNNPRRLSRDDIVEIYNNGAVRPGSAALRPTARAKARRGPGRRPPRGSAPPRAVPGVRRGAGERPCGRSPAPRRLGCATPHSTKGTNPTVDRGRECQTPRRWQRSHERLLLCHAVDAGREPRELNERELDDLASGEEPRQSLASRPVVRVVEARDEDGSVGDVEVDVRRGDAVSVIVVQTPLRVVDRHYLEGAARRSHGRPQASDVRVQRVELGVVAVLARQRDDDTRRCEAGERVHVAAGVVVLERSGQPDDLLHAEVLPEHLLGVRPCQPGVAPLVEHHVLGREQRPLPVGVHRPTLEDDGRREAARAGQLDDPRGHPGRLGVVAVEAAVRVVPPLHRAERPATVHEERRRRVARPGVVRRHADELNVGRSAVRPGAAAPTRFVEVARRGDQTHRLVP